jgi:hypothetical protein
MQNIKYGVPKYFQKMGAACRSRVRVVDIVEEMVCREVANHTKTSSVRIGVVSERENKGFGMGIVILGQGGDGADPRSGGQGRCRGEGYISLRSIYYLTYTTLYAIMPPLRTSSHRVVYARPIVYVRAFPSC